MEKAMKKILVIMPTYNGEKYLTEQLESIWHQQGVDVTVLVRDDGSKDGTQALLEQYQREGKLTWYTGAHLHVEKGVFDLMKRAQAYDVDYISFADQDDVWDADKLLVATQFLDTVQDDTPALYYCGQRLVDGELNPIADHSLNDRRTLTTRFVLSDFAGCTGVFNKALLREVVSFEPDYMLMHDTWVLKVCLCLGGKVFMDPNPHMDYRQHGGNTVGLGRSLPAYMKQVDQYLNVYHVEKQIRELVRGYGDRMVPKYRKLAKMICEYRENPAYKKKLLDRRVVDFHAKGLNLTYWLKVQLNRL